MEVFIDNILENIRTINWEGPASFVIILLSIFALYKQWKILLITLFTIVLGWGTQDMIIMNLETNMKVLSLSLLIYCFGGIIALILILISFLKLAL